MDRSREKLNQEISSASSEGYEYPITSRAVSVRTLTGFQNNLLILPTYIVAVCESRGLSAEVGIAAIDVRTSECIISQFNDSSLYINLLYFLNLYTPKRILLCASSNADDSGIVQLLETIISKEDIYVISRRNFNDNLGQQAISLYSVEPVLEGCIDFQSKYYCLSSFYALIRYLEDKEEISFRKNSLKISFKTLDGCMFIDSQTASSLEIVLNNQDRKSKHHLLGTINYTSTPMGYRMLRLQLLQPPKGNTFELHLDLSTIHLRHQFVEEMQKSESTAMQLKNEMKSLIDIEVLISRMAHTMTKQTCKTPDFKVANILALKHILSVCSRIDNLLSEHTNELAQTICFSLRQTELDILRERIDEIINCECSSKKHQYEMKLNKINAVNDGINGLLDIARKNFQFQTSQVEEYVKNLSDKHKLSLKCLQNQKSGYFISINEKELTVALPSIFINVTKKKSRMSFTTLDLVKMNERIKECSTEIFILTDQILTELNDEIRSYLKNLYLISGAFSLLDFLLSLTFFSVSNKHMTKPEFSDTLAIKDSRHPILDSVVNYFVPNNIFCCDACNFQIITSPNMSGKTTYLKQIGLLVILSSIGSWVPASFASVRLTDKILSRFDNADDISSNSSTFLNEMRQISFILHNFTSKSLILIDELGRGTSNVDGFGIMFSFCEQLIKEHSFIFLATHFSNLAEFLTSYPNVIEITFGVLNEDAKLKFSYSLQKGGCKIANYGIKLAEELGFESNIIKNALEMSKNISQQREYQRKVSTTNSQAIERNKKIQFVSTILQILRNSSLPRHQLITLLKEKIQNFQLNLD